MNATSLSIEPDERQSFNPIEFDGFGNGVLAV
jgi:hypothetical protein